MMNFVLFIGCIQITYVNKKNAKVQKNKTPGKIGKCLELYPLIIVANSPRFTGKLLDFRLLSRIPQGFGIVTNFSQILKR